MSSVYNSPPPGLTSGLTHSCRCGAEFCYICGLRWRTCICDQWNEPQLYVRGAELHEQQWGPNVDEGQRDRLIRRKMENILETHDCNHESWLYRRDSRRCDGCREDLPDYLYQCLQCRFRVCRRCK